MFAIRMQGLTRAILFASNPNHTATLLSSSKRMREEDEIDRGHKIDKTAGRTR
jgi:hypothetical protein